MTPCSRCGTSFAACRSMGRESCCGACATNKTLHGARYVFHPTATGHVSHGAGTTCWLCAGETCGECFHTVEDDLHAGGCPECACPLHLTIGD